MQQSVLVTGAAGFLGSQVVRQLAMDGARVVAIDVNADRCRQLGALSGVSVLAADYCRPEDHELIAAACGDTAYLVHLAGYIQSSVSGGTYESDKAIAVNVQGTLLLLQRLKKRLSGVCLASTLDVYGDPHSLPLTEDHVLRPETFYAASKAAMEWFAHVELGAEVPLAIARFSHLYGPAEPHRKALSFFVEAIRAEQPPVIYGDGSDARDYLHVRDAAAAVCRIVVQRAAGVFNVASGTTVRLRELAELVIRVSGKPLRISYRDRRGAVRNISCDTAKLRSSLGFNPRISLEEGVREMIGS